MAHQFMPKIFRNPHKNPPPPSSYILNVLSLKENLFLKTCIFNLDNMCEISFSIEVHLSKFYIAHLINELLLQTLTIAFFID